MSKIKNNKRIAILITCFNRKQETLACLNYLELQDLPEDIAYDVILVDDGSTDGTAEAVRERYNYVNIVSGSGNLFWNQGMRLAWKTAIEHYKYDFYLLLNDDTHLNSSALALLLVSENELINSSGKTGIIVGSTIDPQKKTLTYGGVSRVKNYIGFRFGLVAPENKLVPCDTFNANCVLISREIVDAVGVLDPAFSHGLGDYDYGLRATQQGYSCWVAPGFVGECARNEGVFASFDPSLPLAKRKTVLESPKGLPTNEWLYFVKTHGSAWAWTLLAIQLKLRTLFPDLWEVLRRMRGRKN